MADTEATAVVSRYRRYKPGTKKVVGWLAQSASHCCDIAAKFNCFKTDTDQQADIKVPSKVLKSLADIIASAEADVPIPQSILRVLEDVIALRTDYATWYEGQAISDKTDLAARNESHKHYIKVLKEIHAALSQSTKSQEFAATAPPVGNKKPSKGKKNKNAQKDGLAGLANLFDLLDLEEPVSAPLSQAPPPATKSPEQWRGKSFALEDDQDNEAVALWCILADMNDVRQYVRQLWLEHLEGQTSLSTAGMVTDIAMGMIERAAGDFVRQYPRFTDWDSSCDYLRVSMAMNSNLVYVYCKDSDAFASRTNVTGSPADLLCATAGLLLRTFSEGAYRFTRAVNSSSKGTLGGYVKADSLMSPRPRSEF